MKNISLRKQFIAIVFPLALQNLLSALVSASDALMLGGLNQASLSAVSLATQVTFVATLFYNGIIGGTTVLSAQYWGNGKPEKVEEVMGIALRYASMVSVAFWLACNLIPHCLMRIFTSDAQLIQLGVPYLQIVGWSYLCMGITQIYFCVMKNTGRTMRSTVYGTISLVLNLALNAILIYGLFGAPKMEIKGAALATLIARLAELVFVLAENMRADVVRIKVKKIFMCSRWLHKDYMKYTLPVLANSLVWGCGFTMFTVIMGRLGSDAVAANSIANIVKNLILCVCYGISTGSGILVGNLLGADEIEGAKKLGDKCLKLTIIAGAVTGLLVLIISPLVVSMMTNLTEAAQHYLQIMLVVCSYYIIGKSINCTVISGIFCAGGDTKFGFVCDSVTMWAVVVPIGMLAAFVLELPVIWVYVLLNIDEIIKLPVVFRHFKKYQWAKNLVKKEECYEEVLRKAA
ncbi:MAG: MATE family efflux transporter [Lachnospiraceae bacterium]|nr:MATE family efflux transporter [Lachnospiraceae bacterium]